MKSQFRRLLYCTLNDKKTWKPFQCICRLGVVGIEIVSFRGRVARTIALNLTGF